jgi:hypothetical protein
VHYAWAATHAGDWAAAGAAAHEAAALSIDTGQPQYGLTAELVAALVAAHRGTEDVEELLGQPERNLLATNGGPLLATAHLARGAAALGEGRHEQAFEHLWPVFDEPDPAFHRFMRWPALLDLVEAGTSSGRTETLPSLIAELGSIAARSKPPILVIQLACARPLLAADADAEELYSVALGTWEYARIPPPSPGRKWMATILKILRPPERFGPPRVAWLGDSEFNIWSGGRDTI